MKNRFAVCVERKKRRSTQNLITFYTFFAHILFPSAHSEISKIRKLKSVFDGLKINSFRKNQRLNRYMANLDTGNISFSGVTFIDMLFLQSVY